MLGSLELLYTAWAGIHSPRNILDGNLSMGMVGLPLLGYALALWISKRSTGIIEMFYL